MAFTVKRVGSHHWAVEGYGDDRYHPVYRTKREAQAIADLHNADADKVIDQPTLDYVNATIARLRSL